MPLNFDLRPVVQQHTAIPFESLSVVQNLNDFQLNDIQLAVVFIFAVWSGPAVTGLRQFTHLLSRLDLGSLPVIILDIDCLPPEDMMRIFGHLFHGAGETLWIRQGKIVAEECSFSKTFESLALNHTQELLRSPGSS